MVETIAAIVILLFLLGLLVFLIEFIKKHWFVFSILFSFVIAFFVSVVISVAFNLSNATGAGMAVLFGTVLSLAVALYKKQKLKTSEQNALQKVENDRRELESQQYRERRAKEEQWEFQIRSGNLPVNQSLKEDNRSNYFITMRVIGSDGNFVDLQSIKFGDSMDALTFARDIRHKLYSDCVVRKAESGTAYVVIASEVSTLTLHPYQSNIKKVYEFVNPIYDVYNQSDDEDDEEYIPAPPKYTTGLEYERYVARSLESEGCKNVKVTQASGDFGADIIFEREGVKFCAQCKLYSKPVGISAVQEVIGAKAHYKCAFAMVITNSTYTEAARQLAEENAVILVDEFT